MISRLILTAFTCLIVTGGYTDASAKDVPSPVALMMKHKHQFNGTHLGSKAEHKKQNLLHLKLTKAQCEEIEQSLSEAYGPAISSRGNIRIWEIINQNRSYNQSKMVTIMAGQEQGQYFAKLDRKGAAVSNNPRLRKPKKVKAIKTLPKQSKGALRYNERD